MNAFEQYANNNEQQLIDDLFTIKRSLKDIFNINDAQYYHSETDNFKLAINGMDNLLGKLNRDKTKIVFTANGLDKFQISYDDEKSIKNVQENLIPKMRLKPSKFTIGKYSQMCISIEFDRLTDDVIHDIMLLTNGTKAVLRPKNVRSF